MEGANIYQIAKNCRTSVGMIEKYYAVHIKTSLDAAAINIVRSKKTGWRRKSMSCVMKVDALSQVVPSLKKLKSTR